MIVAVERQNWLLWHRLYQLYFKLAYIILHCSHYNMIGSNYCNILQVPGGVFVINTQYLHWDFIWLEYTLNFLLQDRYLIICQSISHSIDSTKNKNYYLLIFFSKHWILIYLFISKNTTSTFKNNIWKCKQQALFEFRIFSNIFF